ncbi:hypothetical protein MXB_4727 [Myxobolus squamalis]|nr:hypothetical protein MXB_4727 [Myxobolus squamalis]
MPILTIRTNIACEKIPSDLIQKLTCLISTITGKPQSVFKYVCVSICSCDKMMFGGTVAPCAYIEFKNLGSLPHRSDMTKKVMDLMTSSLDIAGDR